MNPIFSKVYIFVQRPDQACRVCSRMYFGRSLTQQIMLNPTHSRPSAACPAAAVNPCFHVSHPGIPLAFLLTPFGAISKQDKGILLNTKPGLPRQCSSSVRWLPRRWTVNTARVPWTKGDFIPWATVYHDTWNNFKSWQFKTYLFTNEIS